MSKFKWYINDDAIGHGDYQIVVEKYYADESEYGLEYDSFKTEQEAKDYINRIHYEQEAENYIKRKNYE